MLPREITVEEKRQALATALGSRTFSRALQLRKFLSFICESALAGSGDSLSEYVIAIDVFHRSADFSAGEDSYVRTRAYELRHKLERLYKLELQGAPVRIVMPKGSYLPAFERNELARDEQAAWVAAKEPRRSSLPWGPIAIAALLGALAGGLLLSNVSLPRADPILAEAWGRLAGPGANVAVCVATPLQLIAGPASHQAPDSRVYPLPEELYPVFREHRTLDPAQRLGLTVTDTSAAIGTLNAVVATAGVLNSFHQSFQILPERIATISTLRKRNAVLLGSPVDSEALTNLLQKTALNIVYDESEKEFVIVNHQPGNGIPPKLVPRKSQTGEFTDVYGIVTVLREHDSDDEVTKIVFAGITSIGTQGAAEYFTSAAHLRALREQLTHDRQPGFPASYQVLVKSSLNRLSLLSYEYAGYAVLVK